MKPLSIEIIAYAPTAYFHCQTCEFVWQQAGLGQQAHAEQIAHNLPADVMHDYVHLSDWVVALIKKYRERVVVRVIDAASIEGFIKSLRYRVRRYPAIIIAASEKLSPADLATAEQTIAQRLAASSSTS